MASTFILPRRCIAQSSTITGRVPYTWPDPEPEGPYLTPLTKLVTLLAATPTFRTRCGLEADDPLGSEKLIEGRAGIQRRIFYPEAQLDTFPDFPIAVIQSTEWAARTVAGGVRNETLPKGTLRLTVFDDDRMSGNMEKSLRDFLIFLGNLANDLRSQFAFDDEITGETLRNETIRTERGSMEGPFLPPQEMIAARDGRWFWHHPWIIDWAG